MLIICKKQRPHREIKRSSLEDLFQYWRTLCLSVWPFCEIFNLIFVWLILCLFDDCIISACFFEWNKMHLSIYLYLQVFRASCFITVYVKNNEKKNPIKQMYQRMMYTLMQLKFDLIKNTLTELKIGTMKLLKHQYTVLHAWSLRFSLRILNE